MLEGEVRTARPFEKDQLEMFVTDVLNGVPVQEARFDCRVSPGRPMSEAGTTAPLPPQFEFQYATRKDEDGYYAGGVIVYARDSVSGEHVKFRVQVER